MNVFVWIYIIMAVATFIIMFGIMTTRAKDGDYKLGRFLASVISGILFPLVWLYLIMALFVKPEQKQEQN